MQISDDTFWGRHHHHHILHYIVQVRCTLRLLSHAMTFHRLKCSRSTENKKKRKNSSISSFQQRVVHSFFSFIVDTYASWAALEMVPAHMDGNKELVGMALDNMEGVVPDSKDRVVVMMVDG
jgi:hypothetical protein